MLSTSNESSGLLAPGEEDAISACTYSLVSLEVHVPYQAALGAP